ncbi:hypothetical protein [Massilia orientalis]|uniref:Uncharacterized protein n=1 Tax=Massilia orientalis TaxID=3050128 RepID=A0ACC7MIL0_9BURK|nr:hypothetical protein [Massilia sp. YIM B02787]
MSEIKARTFGHTAAALIVFESTLAQRARAWETAECAQDIDAAERADIEALIPVQEAFFRDTCDINSRIDCMRMDIASLRRIAKASTAAAAAPNGANHFVTSYVDDLAEADDSNSAAPR